MLQIEDLKNMFRWLRDVTKCDYPGFAHLLAIKADININKLTNDGTMTHMFNSAWLMSSLLRQEVNGTTWNLLCHNPLQTVRVNDVLDSLTSFP